MGASAIRRGRGIREGFGAPLAGGHGPSRVRAGGHYSWADAGQGARHGRPAPRLHQVGLLHEMLRFFIFYILLSYILFYFFVSSTDFERCLGEK